MPLRAVSETGNIQAFEYDDARWADLKGHYRTLSLRMPRCDSAAVPKTSSLGNFFFAHNRKGDCATAPESAKHLYCNSLIAQAAQNAGWTVTTERAGTSPAGEDWIADVFCEKGGAKVAFEVQMSPQAADETVRRQRRYKDSGVRGAWFYGFKTRSRAEEFDRGTPIFKLSEVSVGELPTIEHFSITLPAFVDAMLSKRLVWTIPEHDRPLQIEYLRDVCWACQKPVKQVYGYLNRIEDAEGEWHERYFTVASVSKALEAVLTVVTNDELAAQGVNRIERYDVIRGKPTNWPYSNACLHCRAPQNNFHIGEKLRTALYGPDCEPSVGAAGTVVKREPLTGYAPISRVVRGLGRWELRPVDFDSVAAG